MKTIFYPIGSADALRAATIAAALLAGLLTEADANAPDAFARLAELLAD